MASRARPVGALFPLGRKKVFLPTMSIALLRATPSPYIAKFRVPLNCNKFDVRDYLLHMYGLRALRVMTQINLQKLRRANEVRDSKLPASRWVRPKSIKTALVELEEPFIYPPAPDDPEAYGKYMFDARQASDFDQKIAESPAFKNTIGRGQWEKNNKRALARWSKKESSKPS